jgi:hypothetical protein
MLLLFHQTHRERWSGNGHIFVPVYHGLLYIFVLVSSMEPSKEERFFHHLQKSALP